MASPSGNQSESDEYTLPGQAQGYFCRALGDSLTIGASNQASGSVASYPAFLQADGVCSNISNEGVAGQTSTQIAVRSGGTQTFATIAGGVISEKGSVGITFKHGYEPVTRYSTSGVAVSIEGVRGIVTYHDGSPQFTRSASGASVPAGGEVLVTVLTGSLNDGFVIIWAGKNNAAAPDQILSDIASIVAILPEPKRYVVLSVTNSNIAAQWKGGASYKQYLELDRTLASKYPDHYLDIRSLLVAAYNPAIPEDVLDQEHDVMPSSLRFFATSILQRDISDTKSCTDVPAVQRDGSTVVVDQERIYISSSSNGFATAAGCVRGFAGTTAAIHKVDAPVVSLDATHLNAAGQAFVAQQIAFWMRTHHDPPETKGANPRVTMDSLFASPPAIGALTPPILRASQITAGATFGVTAPVSVVGSVDVLFGGVGYNTTPKVSFSNGATGIVYLSGTSVRDVKLTSTGTPSSGPLTVTFDGNPTKPAYAVVTPKRFGLLLEGPSATMPNVIHTFYGSGACEIFATVNGTGHAKLCGAGDGNHINVMSDGKGGLTLSDGGVLAFRSVSGSGSAELVATSDGNSVQVGGKGGIVPADSSIQTSGAANRPWATTYTKGFVCAIATKSSAYAMKSDDCTVLCDAAAGAVTITLPESTTNNIYSVKKIDASVNKCTVSGSGHSIDGLNAVQLSAPYAGVQIQGDGQQWWILK